MGKFTAIIRNETGKAVSAKDAVKAAKEAAEAQGLKLTGTAKVVRITRR